MDAPPAQYRDHVEEPEKNLDASEHEVENSSSGRSSSIEGVSLGQLRPGKPDDTLEVDEADDEDNTFLRKFRSTKNWLPDKDPTISSRRNTIAFAVFFFVLILAIFFISYKIFSPPPPYNGPPPALIIASYADQDLSWVGPVARSWQVYRYCNDCDEEEQPTIGLPIYQPASSIGREANVYLTYLIDNYENLPRFMLFLHGHNRAWHQPELAVDLVRALNLSAVTQEDYVALKCTVDTWCRPKAALNLRHGPVPLNPKRTGVENVFKMMPAFWKYVFEDEPLSKAFRDTAGAQFALTAEAVRRHPLSFYQRLRQPMQSNASLEAFDKYLRDVSLYEWGNKSSEMTAENVFGEGGFSEVDDYAIGVLMEKFWHRIFGKKDIFCPRRRWCNRVFFNNAFSCPDYNEGKEFFDHIETKCTVDEVAIAKVQSENAQKKLIRFEDGAGSPPLLREDIDNPTKRTPKDECWKHWLPD